MAIFVFDIETIPDVELGRTYYDLPSDISDEDVASLMFAKRREQTGSDFLKHPMHKVVAISVVFENNGQIRVWSLGTESSDEKEIIQRFFEGIEKYKPNLVSWNGSGFDLPVLHYRALKHEIQAPAYWDTGTKDKTTKWDNYTSRYHDRHMDLMDKLASYQAKAYASLEEIALLLGLPGKLGMHGSKVWPEFQRGNIQGIRDYCETDVLNTYLVYLSMEVMRGTITPLQKQNKVNALVSYLEAENKTHFKEFLAAWKRPGELSITNAVQEAKEAVGGGSGRASTPLYGVKRTHINKEGALEMDVPEDESQPKRRKSTRLRCSASLSSE